VVVVLTGVEAESEQQVVTIQAEVFPAQVAKVHSVGVGKEWECL
jgi:hypothetical protein